MVSNEDIFKILGTIPDPEMPISITDLGLIEDVFFDDTTIRVTVLPTFIGCFALPTIERRLSRNFLRLRELLQ